ncbi:MAG TPA: HAD family hydrolase [Ktedonobacterales bacterium]|jgi:putative hydrolase of the HAD superfamily
MSTRAVLFDLDDTLLADDAATQAALRATAALAATRRQRESLGAPLGAGLDAGLDAEALARAAWRHARDSWERSPHRDYFETFGISAGECLWGRFIGEDPRLRPIARWAITYQLETWRQALADFELRDDLLAATLAERFRMEKRARHDWLFADALPTLDRLHGAYALALITNGAPDIQRDKLARCGVEPYFPVVAVSVEAGVAKPDPAIFAQTLDALEVSPAEAVMVGDSPARDILGANRAGVRAIWIRRAGQPLTSGALPDATITTLDDLAALL